MGLTTWKNAPQGPIRKADVTIAKNYLAEPEIAELNRVVSMYLDYAEDQAHRRRPMHMADWVGRLDAFLQFNERNILTHAGAVTRELAERTCPWPNSPHTNRTVVSWRPSNLPATSTNS